ncbi:MAG: CIA30 family protein [Bacteroidales bacterium]|nr:CIA30 family protein [Bacteroidales bacterium]
MKKSLLFITCVFITLYSWGQNFAFPQNVTYQYGIKASTPDTDRIQSLYATWKNNHYEDGAASGNTGFARVKFDSPNQNQTVSEGIGYGMLIFVYMENATNKTQSDFNKLYAYYKKFGRKNGYLMEWKINGYSSVLEAGSATDGDLDVALALVLAHKQWGSTGTVNYIKEAENLIDAIWQYQVISSSKLIKPGDHWDNALNPCYFTTATIKLFNEVQTQEGFSKTHDWASVYSTSQTYLKNSQSSKGLWPDWTNTSTTPTACKPQSIGGGGCDFSWDACRTPWRVAWDYIWWGSSDAQTMSAKTATFTDTKSATNLNGPMTTNGDALSPSYNNSVFIGGLAASYMTNSTKQSNLDSWYGTLKSKNEGLYYAPTLQILYLLTLSGNAPNFYANAAPTAPKFVSSETSGSGTNIYITTNKSLKTPSSSELSNFTFKINNVTQNAAFTGISLLSSTVISLTLSTSVVVKPGDVMTISYTPGSIQSTDNLTLEAFTSKTVQNKLASNNTIIADCEDDNVTKLLTHWYSFNDNSEGGASTVTPFSTDDEPFVMTAGGANATANAAKITYSLSKGTLSYDPFVGLGFAMKKPEAAFDLSGSTGISFYHKGDAVTLSVALSTNTNTNYYSTSVSAHTDWTLVTVAWGVLSQANWGADTHPVTFDASKITKFQWQKQAASGSGSVWIDEVQVDGKVLTLPQGAVVKTALVNSISSAQSIHNSAVEGAAVGNYPVGSKATLLNAITAAKTVNGNASATQLQVDNAKAILDGAVVTFQNSVIVTVVDKQALQAAISAAQTFVNSINEGTELGTFPVGTKATLNQAITTAKTVLNSGTATQAQIDNAQQILENAVANIKDYTNYNILNATIVAAQQLHNSAFEGTAVGNYATGSKATLQTAINTAKTVAENVNATQDQINAAQTALQTAISVFGSKRVIGTVDKESLDKAINTYTTFIETVKEKTPELYRIADIETFDNAISEAIVVLENDFVTQEEVDKALAVLKEAYDDFKKTILTSSKSEVSEKDVIYFNKQTNELAVKSERIVATVSVQNVLGQVLANKRVNQTSTKLEISGEVGNILLVSIVFEDGTLKTIKLLAK